MTSQKGPPSLPKVSPGGLGLFVLYEKDWLQISATLGVCLFLQTPVGRVIAHLLSRHGGRKIKALSSMLQPCIWGRLVMEFGVLLAIVILTVVEAFHTDIRPFTRDPYLLPGTCLRLIYNIAIGRFLVCVGNILSTYDVILQSGNRVNEIRSLTGHTGKFAFDLVYYVTSIASNVISLGFGENHLLVLTSSIMELNCVHLAFRRLNELVTWRTKARASLMSTLFFSAIFSITCIVLPIIFVGLAVSKESPLLMSVIPSIWFAFCCFFYAIFHSYLLYNCVRQLVQALSDTSSLPQPPSIDDQRNGFADCRSNNTVPFAIPYSPDFFTNDLRCSLDPLKTPVKGKSPEACDWQEKSLIKAKTGLNFGFLRCYDNRNLCSSHVSGMSDKVNISLKKATEKEKLFYWSNPTLNAEDKIPYQEVLCEEDYKTQETGNLLSSADKLEESFEYDSPTVG